MGKALVERGHDITVVTGFPRYNIEEPAKYHGLRFADENVDGIRVIRQRSPALPRCAPIARGVDQFLSAYAMYRGGLRAGRHDGILVYSPPLPFGLAGRALAERWDVPVTLNVQDLFPQSAIDLGVLRNPILIRLLETLERRLYRSVDHVTVHSLGNKDHVVRKGTPEERVSVMPNFIDTAFIRPDPGDGLLRREWGLEDKFIVSFGGVLGYSQDIDTILESACLLHEHEDIQFVIVGDGVEKARLGEKAAALGLNNVRFYPMLPRERYPLLLNASDVSLATLHRSVKTPVVPSKILSIMAAGVPVVAAMDLAGDAPKLIAEALCGYALPPGDASQLANVIIDLRDNPQCRSQLGRNGRQYAETHLSLDAYARRYEDLFQQVAHV